VQLHHAAHVARPRAAQSYGFVFHIAELGAEPLGGTPEALAALLRAEQAKWGRIIRELGIKLQ